jgi:hypothetical protein
MEEKRFADSFGGIELPKYSLEEVLEEAKSIELLPEEYALYAAEELPPEPETEIQETLPNTNVAQIYILPEDPSKRERAEQILRSVEKEVGIVGTPAAFTGVEIEPEHEKPRKQRAGDIIRNILPDIVQQDKKSDPLGRREARKERERAVRERKRQEREALLREKTSREEEETRILREMFFQPADADSGDNNSTIRIPLITEEMLAETAAIEIAETEDRHERDEDANEILAQYASKVDTLRMLTFGAAVACILMLLYTLGLELSWKLPAVLTDNVIVKCSVFLALQLIVMVLGSGILLTGLYDIFKLRINTESAVVLLAFFSLCDTVRILIGGGAVGDSMPLALPSGAAIVFAMMGTRLGKSGFSRTIKAVKAMDKPVAVKAEYKRVNKGLVLSKSTASSKGFFFSLTRVDSAEQTHSVYTPLSLVGITVFALLSCLYNNRPYELLRSITVIGCGAAVLTPMWAFNAPFAKVSRALARRKAALGGWTGAENITEARNVLFRDNDLFRASKISLSSFKFERGVKSELAMQYAGSIALEANCGLTTVFSGLMKENGISPAEVTGFEVREGGGLIGFINDHRVILASDRFVKLNDINTMSLPIGIPGAVYLIVDGLAVAVFIIQYAPSDKVQKLLLRLERTAIQPLLATRDFNITPAMIRAKFKVDLSDIELLPYPERFKLASDYADEKVKPIALLANDDMGVLTEVAESAVWLHRRVRLASTLSLVFGVVGMLLMFYTCFSGGANGVYAHRLFLYQFITWAFTMVLTMVGRK